MFGTGQMTVGNNSSQSGGGGGRVERVLKDVFLPWYNAYRFLMQNVEGLDRVGYNSSRSVGRGGGEGGIERVLNDVFLPWYNAYRFLMQNVERVGRLGSSSKGDRGEGVKRVLTAMARFNNGFLLNLCHKNHKANEKISKCQICQSSISTNKHSESIAKAIQVPYRAQQISKRHNGYKTDKRGQKEDRSTEGCSRPKSRT